ncbi:hypothetical protein FRC10_006216 [Ceratobasidium sp. 414]|nr:hypothetical protein FRC10_006216 [Ceratobasidium sp. 414]
MSAYGAISLPSNRSTQALETRSYSFAKKPGCTVLVVHVTRQSAPTELIGLLNDEFARELEAGQTYPQESMDRATFESYFFAADVFVGMVVADEEAATLAHKSIEGVRAGRSWDESVVGHAFNHPSVPSHDADYTMQICNAGFVVRPRFRRLGVGKILGESYVQNAPLLGYKASVFNLVYANNAGSLAIWDRLGFSRVGLIPKAGRLKTTEGEAYFDAVVVYKSFED